jgi:hypothetical protein
MSGLDDIVAHGSHDQYLIVDDNGSLRIDDSITNRDGEHTGVQQIRFDDGVGILDHTGTAADVLRLYQAALGRAPDLGGLNFWTHAIDDSHVSLISVANSLATSAEFIHNHGDPVDQDFVQQLYQNVLNRAGDAGGVQFWEDRLGAGASRGQVVAAFAESPENRSRTLSTAGDKHDAEAYRLYQAALGRAPDQSGQAFWSSTLASGATPAQVAQSFIASTEFQEHFGILDDNQFVSALYQNVLHRTGDVAGQQFWEDRLHAGTSRSDVMVGFSDGLENRMQTAGATHDGWVFIHA